MTEENEEKTEEKKPPRFVVSRCFECDSCQEFILTPSQAPECTSLRVTFPNDKPPDLHRFGTERKVFRAIEQWANDHFRCLNAINFVEVLWGQGTTVRPVLRRKGVWPKDRPVHPYGGYEQYGCSCTGCRPPRKRRKTA
jgi:hypothetical protein